jgi:hypothetical protein
MKVGAALIGLLLENSHLPDGIAGSKPKTLTSKHGSSSSSAAGAAAFEYTYIKTGAKKQQAFVTASQGLVKVLLADRSLAAALLVKVPPMMLPPIPWEGYNIGGQLTSRCVRGGGGGPATDDCHERRASHPTVQGVGFARLLTALWACNASCCGQTL